MPVSVKPGVLADAPEALATSTYVETTTARAGYVINLAGVTSLTGGGATTLDGQDAGSTTFPTGCIVALTETVADLPDILRFYKLKGTYVAATDLAAGVVKPTNSDATLNPVHWKQCA